MTFGTITGHFLGHAWPANGCGCRRVVRFRPCIINVPSFAGPGVEGSIINYTVIVDNFPQISIPFVSRSGPVVSATQPDETIKRTKTSEKGKEGKKVRHVFFSFSIYFLIIDSLSLASSSSRFSVFINISMAISIMTRVCFRMRFVSRKALSLCMWICFPSRLGTRKGMDW